MSYCDHTACEEKAHQGHEGKETACSCCSECRPTEATLNRHGRRMLEAQNRLAAKLTNKI